MMCFAVGYMEVAMKKIAIYGAGGTGRMIADQLLEKGVPIECFFDGDSTKCGGGGNTEIFLFEMRKRFVQICLMKLLLERRLDTMK